MSVKNKFTSILLSLCMLASFVPVNFTAFASDEPELINGAYQIESAEDLVWFAKKVNGGDRTANAVLLTWKTKIGHQSVTDIIISTITVTV